MSKSIMRQTLNELDFKFIPQNGVDAWSKIYKGFILFIGKEMYEEKYLASITVGELEISIPNTVDDIWVCEFDSQNSLVNEVAS